MQRLRVNQSELKLLSLFQAPRCSHSFVEFCISTSITISLARRIEREAILSDHCLFVSQIKTVNLSS